MKIKNIEKRLQKIGAKEIERSGGHIRFTFKSLVITIHSNWNEDEALFIHTRRENDVSNMIEDYTAGVFAHSIKGMERQIENYLKNA